MLRCDEEDMKRPLLIGLYIIELLAFFQNRKTFQSSFYRIFIVLALVNIVACSLGTFAFRLPLYPIVNRFYVGLRIEMSNLISTSYVGTYYLNCLSEFLGVLLAFNRFTALFLPIAHDKFWRWFMFVGTLLCMLCAFPPIVYLLTDGSVVYATEPLETGYAYFIMVGLGSEFSIYFNMVLVTVVANSISSLLYGACLIRLCKFTAHRNYTIERNFFLVGFLTMIFSLPFMGAMIYFHLTFSLLADEFNFDVAMFISFQLPWLTDLKAQQYHHTGSLRYTYIVMDSIYFNMVLVTVVANSISSLLFGACLIRLCKFTANRNYTIERNFFLVGFLTMLFSLPIYFHLTLSLSAAVQFNSDVAMFIIFQLPWLTDLKYLSPAPMLLITNKSIRQSIVKMLCSRKLKDVSTLSKNTPHAHTTKIVTI